MRLRPVSLEVLREQISALVAERDEGSFVYADVSAARRQKLNPRPSVNRHVAPCHEFFLVHRGEARIETPQQHFRLRPGMLLVVPPGVVHEELPADPFQPSEVLCFHIDGTTAELFNVTYSSPYNSLLEISAELPGSEDLESAAVLILSELVHRGPRWGRATHDLLSYLSHVMFRRLENGSVTHHVTTGSRDPREWPRIDAAIAFCRANIRYSLRIGEVATLFGYSPRHLGRLFRRAMGQPFSEHLRALRTEVAMDLLRTSDLAVAEVAESVGYPDPANFTRAFRREVGLSPKAYRLRCCQHGTSIQRPMQSAPN